LLGPTSVGAVMRITACVHDLSYPRGRYRNFS
jgi:hypothetical protein